MFTYLSQRWAAWPYKGWTLIALLAAIFVIVGLTISNLTQQGTVGEEKQKPLPEVMVQTASEIASTATIDTTTNLEVSGAAPLISRTGGRVTAIRARLGSKVAPGQIIVEIDGGTEANMAQVQAAAASRSLALFADIETQTKASLDNAVGIAQNSFNAARAGKTITTEMQSKAQQLAETSVDQAQIAREQTVAGNENLLIRSANIGVEAAKLAQDQAQLAQRLALQQVSDGVLQAQRGLAAAQIARSQTLASLASQKEGIASQLRIAAEQVKMMQIASPVYGEVARLNVQVGDFIAPGSTVGEVASRGNARVTIFVPETVRNSLTIGQEIDITVDGQKKAGIVQEVATTPSGASSLWQVNITTTEALSSNSTVTVSLPLSQKKTGTVFIPLDALNVREAGTVVLTVGGDNTIVEHAFTPVHYYNDVVEGTADISAEDKIVVSGNRVLRQGDKVTISKP